MLDPIIADRLQMIVASAEMIELRMKEIHAASDFMKDERGMTIMDSVCMRLQFIGECLKKIEKTDKDFSAQIELDLSPAIRFRDFIAHHYEKADYEIIYNTCIEHLPELKRKISQVLKANK